MWLDCNTPLPLPLRTKLVLLGKHIFSTSQGLLRGGAEQKARRKTFCQQPKIWPAVPGFYTFLHKRRLPGGRKSIWDPQKTLYIPCFKTRWIHLVSKWAPMAAPGAMAEDVNSTNSRQFKLYELCIWTSTGGCLETTIVGRCICAAVKPRGFRLGDPGVVSCQRIHRSKWLAGQAPGPVGEAPC